MGYSPARQRSSRAAEQRCLSLLQSSCTLLKLLQALAFLLKSGLHSNLFALTRFASAAASLGPAAAAVASTVLFSPSSSPIHFYDTFLINTALRALSPTPLHPFLLFPLMLRLFLSPNQFTFPFLFKAIAALPSPLTSTSLAHGSALRFGFAGDSFVQNTLIHAYAVTGDAGIVMARKVFDETHRSSAITFSAMISGYVRSGRSRDAIVLFREMQVGTVQPDDVTIMTVLSACVDLGALNLTKWLNFYVERGKVHKSLCLCNALVDALAKCGDVDAAMDLFVKMPERNIISWTSVIDGLAMHCRGIEAMEVFEAMMKAGIKPDAVTFISLLTACSHSGLVNIGRRYFDSMTWEFGIEPRIEHYGCMVDLYSRAGLVEEAMQFVQGMPIKPNPVIWRTLIAGCRVYRRLDLGERVMKQLIKEEPSYGSNYVLLSNFYALNNRWEKKREVRRVMDQRGMYKVAGCSLFELDGEVYEFIAGGEKYARQLSVYVMMEEIGQKIKKAGFLPSSSEMLLDIDEEDKQDALHWHSEKLAIAFALLNTTPGTVIRIVKNLRVCVNCHSALKFISRIYKRDIIVRDRSRFHCFKDGACLCKDFW